MIHNWAVGLYTFHTKVELFTIRFFKEGCYVIAVKDEGERTKMRGKGIALIVILGLVATMAFNMHPAKAVIPGDVDGDSHVDILDAINASYSYGKGLGDAGWNPLTDLNGDNTTDIFDFVMLASLFGSA